MRALEALVEHRFAASGILPMLTDRQAPVQNRMTPENQAVFPDYAGIMQQSER